MINESYYWKQSLLDAASWMRRLKLTERSSSRSFVRLEREVFVGFYAIRKLVQSTKVTDLVRKKTFDLVSFRCMKRVDPLGFCRIDESYDLSSAIVETHDLLFLCNQFIHSHLFLPVMDENSRLTGFYVNSDLIAQKKIFLVDLSQLLEAFRIVGRDDPCHIAMVLDPITGRRDVSLS